MQHAGHDGPVREVASELGLVGGDALDTDGILAGHALEDLVDEQEGVPVGEDLADGRVIREGLRVGKASRILLGERTNLLLLCTARPS